MANVEKERAERKSILRKHWGFLKANFILKYVSDALIQDGVITPADWMNMKQKHSINSEMNEDFLFTLYNEKLDCFPKFVKALRINGFEPVADVLDGKISPDKFQDEDTREKTSKELKKQHTDENTTLASLEKTIREEGNLTRKGVKGVKSDIDNVKSHVKSIQSDMDEVKSDVRDVKSDMYGVKSDVSTMKTEVRAEVKAEMREAQSEMDRQMKQMLKDYKKQLEQIMKEENEKQVDNIAAALRDKQQASERAMAKMKLEMTKMEKQRKDLEEKKSQLELELKDIRKQLTEANRTKSGTRNETHIRKLVDDLEKSLDEREAENDSLKKSLLKLKTEKIRLRAELEATKTENERLGDVIGMLRRELLQKNRNDSREAHDVSDEPHQSQFSQALSPRRPPFSKSPRQLVPVSSSPRFPPRSTTNNRQQKTIPPIQRYNPQVNTTSTQKRH